MSQDLAFLVGAGLFLLSLGLFFAGLLGPGIAVFLISTLLVVFSCA